MGIYFGDNSISGMSPSTKALTAAVSRPLPPKKLTKPFWSIVLMKTSVVNDESARVGGLGRLFDRDKGRRTPPFWDCKAFEAKVAIQQVLCILVFFPLKTTGKNKGKKEMTDRNI